MDNRMPDVDYEGLDRLLGALSESVASRVHLGETALSEASSVPETLPDAWRDTATSVQVDTLPRGVALRTVVRGVLGHFLPAAAVVIAPLALLSFLANPFEYALNLKMLSLLFLPTLGFALGLGALSPWLYPHSNPDGRRSEVAGFLSLFTCLPLGTGVGWLIRSLGEIPGLGWLLPLLTSRPGGFVVGLVGSGMALAVLAYAPWLRRTSRIALASPPGRWAKVRAISVTGGLGAVAFGSAQLINQLSHGLPTGITLWPGLLFPLAYGGSFGFLVGAAFAIALAFVYRRYAVEELRAWKVGLWAAAAAALPTLVIRIQGAPFALLSVLILWILPGFLMGYATLKLAQRSQ